MDVSAIGKATAGVEPGITSQVFGQNGGKLGKDEFLQMLVVQMQNQDPLDPVKNEAMIAQLAQFSSLEQMQNLNQTFAGFRAENAMLAASQWGGQTLSLELADGSAIEGMVDGVWSLDGVTYVQIGESSIAVNDIARISWPAAGEATGEGEGEPVLPTP